MFEGKSTFGMWEVFKCKLIGIQDRHVPERMKDKYGRFWEPWMTRDFVSLVKEINEAFVKTRKLGTHEANVEYKKSRKKLKQGLRRAESGHEKSLASRIKENPQDFYPDIKSKRVARDRVGSLKDRGGNLCVEPEEMGEVLNEYFASVFTKGNKLVDDESGKGCADSLGHIEIKKEVLGVLKNIKVSFHCYLVF